LLGAGASSGAVMGAAGGIAAKLAGLGVAKAAVLVVAATSVVAYGGAQAARVVPDAGPASAPRVATVSQTPSPAPSSDLAQASPVAVQEAGAAAAAEAQAVERLRRQLRLLRKAAVLGGDPRLAAQVSRLSLVLAAGGGLAGADALRQWNSATRSAMRLLRSIGGGAPGALGSADTLATLVRGAQTQVRLAGAQSDPPDDADPGRAGAVAVTRPAASAAGGSAASGINGSATSSDEAPPSAVDPSSELGGIRDATPGQGGSTGGGPASDLPAPKPKTPIPPGGSQGGSLAP
jgi:hypothetical protein